MDVHWQKIYLCLLDLLSEALTTPVFPKAEVEKLRAQLLTGLAIRAEDTGRYGFNGL